MRLREDLRDYVANINRCFPLSWSSPHHRTWQHICWIYSMFRQGNIWDRSADGSTTFSPVSRRPTVSWRTGGDLNSKRGCLLACFLKSCCSPNRERDMFQGLKLDLTPPYFLICFIKTNSFRVGEPPIMRKMRERLSERMVLNFNLRPRGNFLAIWFDFCQRVS